MNPVRHYWPGLFLVLVACLGIISYTNTALQIGKPFGGFFGNINRASNLWEVDLSTPPWWPGVAPQYLHYGDKLIAIEGQPYDSQVGAIFAAAYRAAPVGQTPIAHLTIRRDEAFVELDLPLSTFSWIQFFDFRLPDLLVGISFWLLGFAVYNARSQEPANRAFAFTMALVSGAFACGVSELFPKSTPLTKSIDLIWGFLTPFAGVSIMYLALLFPQPSRRLPLKWRKLIYVPMFGVALLQTLAGGLRWLNLALPLANTISAFGNQINLGSFGLSVAVYIARLILLVARPSSSRRTRRQAGFMLWGMVLVLPYTYIALTRAFSDTQIPLFSSGIDTRYLLLAVPLTFAFALLRYQTSQSTHPLLIFVFILATSAFLASLGASVYTGFDQYTPPPFGAIFFAVLLSSLFWSTQANWEGLFGRLFQQVRRNYGEVRHFGQQLIGQTNLTELPTALAVALVTNLQLERAAVWLWDEPDHVFALKGRSGSAQDIFENRLTPSGDLTSTPIRLSATTVAPPEWLTPLREQGFLKVIVPLVASGKRVGLLGLGKRWDDEIFDERDLEIIDLIAQQAALFLLTAHQIVELQQMPGRIAEAQEHERLRIAQELHDTIQQFLGRLPFYLQIARDALRTDPTEAERLLQRAINEVETEAQNVRQIRNKLWPQQIEHHFSEALATLTEDFRERTNLAIALTVFPDLDTALPIEERHALYRVIQQALDNITEHARAHSVNILLTRTLDKLHFLIRDDGVGFSAAQREQAETGGFGLVAMGARIAAAGGEINIQSTPGHGTQVSGWLPCKTP